jgi:hypothetical protein
MESFLLTKEMKPEIAINALQKEWEEKKNFEEFTTASLNQAKKDAEIILAEVPSFFEPDIKTSDKLLFESINVFKSEKVKLLKSIKKDIYLYLEFIFL